MSKSISANIKLLYDLTDPKFYVNEPVKAEITVRAKETIEIEEIGWHLVLEARGKIVSEDFVLKSGFLLENTTVEAGKEYKFEVEFVNDEVPTYTGVNVNFTIKLEVYVEEVKKKSGNFIKDLFTRAKEYEKSKTIPYQPKRKGITINDEQKEKTTKTSYAWMLIFVFIAVFVIFISPSWMEFSADLTMYILLGMLGIIVTYLAIVHLLIGKINIQLQKLDDEHFKVKIKNSNNWSFVNQVTAFYEIREEVIDRRGTSSSTIDKQVFKSETRTFNNPHSVLYADMKLLQRYPGTYKIGDSKIYWQIELKIKTILGISFPFRKRFWVG